MLKTVSSVANALGALNYKGTWNATTNTPTLASGVGTQGDYYVVSVAGTTDLDGITNWGVGDWAAFNGSVWQRVEGGADGNFVNLDVSNTGDFGGKVKVTEAGNGEIEVERTGGALINLQAQSARGVIGTNSNHELQLKSNSSGRLKITTAGNVEVMSGNLVIGTSGKGIDFSATAGTGTSELLSDYEEGVWTPTGAGAGAVGVYTKMGDTVFAYCEVTANSVSTNTISGLPFTAGAGNSAIGGYFGRARFAGIFDANGNEVRIRILGTDIKFMTNGGLAGDASATITTGGGGIVQLAISVIYKV
jgi:hypothetical protein